MIKIKIKILKKLLIIKFLDCNYFFLNPINNTSYFEFESLVSLIKLAHLLKIKIVSSN